MSWDPVWERIFRSREWGKYPPERAVRFVASNFYQAPDRSAVRLLDLGCGTGACTWYMAREGFSVSAIDGSATGVEQTRKRLIHEGLTADCQVGDFKHLPWKSASFDGALDNAAIYANPYSECRLAVQEVRRVLKPGGVFLSSNFTPQTWGYGLGEEVEPGGFVSISEGPLKDRGFVLFMTRSQIEHLYEGFDDITIDTEAMTIGGSKHTVELWVVTCRVGKGA